MSDSLKGLFAVVAIALGSLGLSAPALAMCSSEHAAQASSSDQATGPTASTDQTGSPSTGNGG